MNIYKEIIYRIRAGESEEKVSGVLPETWR